MDAITRTQLHNLWSEDRDLQNTAYTSILEATERPVEWAYDVWDELVGGLKHKDNHVGLSRHRCYTWPKATRKTDAEGFEALLK
jgi:hypothetical protein